MRPRPANGAGPESRPSQARSGAAYMTTTSARSKSRPSAGTTYMTATRSKSGTATAWAATMTASTTRYKAGASAAWPTSTVTASARTWWARKGCSNLGQDKYNCKKGNKGMLPQPAGMPRLVGHVLPP